MFPSIKISPATRAGGIFHSLRNYNILSLGITEQQEEPRPAQATQQLATLPSPPYDKSTSAHYVRHVSFISYGKNGQLKPPLCVATLTHLAWQGAVRTLLNGRPAPLFFKNKVYIKLIFTKELL